MIHAIDAAGLRQIIVPNYLDQIQQTTFDVSDAL